MKENGKFSRRDFFKVGALSIAGIGSLLYGYNKKFYRDFGVEFDKDKKLSFEELGELYIKVGSVFNRPQIRDWEPDLTDDFINGWVKEVLEQIDAEGISQGVDKLKDYGIFEPSTAIETNHVLGFSDCENRVKINERFFNKASNIYKNPTVLGTIVHELVHFEAQGQPTCSKMPTALVESTAQIGMIETLTGMAVRGNKTAFIVFVAEWYDMVNGAFLAMAVKENRVKEYEEVRGIIEQSAFSRAREEKMWREWAGDMGTFNEILQNYELLPVEKMFNAHFNNNDIVTDVALPERYFYRSGENWIFTYPPRPATINLDDWAYIMENLESMAAEV